MSQQKKRGHASVLTSTVHNEAELIFSILEHKEKKLISHLDTLTLLRGMGMNPTADDMDGIKDVMGEPIRVLDEMRREEERRRDKERKKEEKKDPKKEKEAKEREKKEKEAKEKAEAKAKAEAQEAEAEGAVVKKKPLTEPAEEVKNIDWTIFINAAEPIYKNNFVEEAEIVDALSTFFGKDKTTIISRDKLIEIVTVNGESVLSPAEVNTVKESFPAELSIEEFAQRIQGTYVPPTAEQIAAKQEEERLEREAAEAKRKAEEEANADPLASLIS